MQAQAAGLTKCKQRKDVAERGQGRTLHCRFACGVARCAACANTEGCEPPCQLRTNCASEKRPQVFFAALAQDNRQSAETF